jgi:hypothetical protein
VILCVVFGAAGLSIFRTVMPGLSFSSCWRFAFSSSMLRSDFGMP